MPNSATRENWCDHNGATALFTTILYLMQIVMTYIKLAFCYSSHSVSLLFKSLLSIITSDRIRAELTSCLDKLEVAVRRLKIVCLPG